MFARQYEYSTLTSAPMHEINIVNTFVFICYPVTFEPINANSDKYNDKERNGIFDSKTVH